MRYKITLGLTSILLLLIACFGIVPEIHAAELRGGKEVTLPKNETNVQNLYVAGGTLRIDAPIIDDIVIVGEDIHINNTVTGSVLAAGENVHVTGDVAGSIRVVGKDIVIDGKVDKDIAVIGGSVTVTKNASISGDILFLGGELKVDGPVGGKVLARGGDVTINNAIGKNIEGQVGTLTLGSHADVTGDLVYAASEKAVMEQGSHVKGDTKFRYIAKEEPANKGFITFGSLYSIGSDIVISLLLVIGFAPFIKKVFGRMMTAPLKTGAIGLAHILVFPLAAICMFTLLWLGITSLLFYGITLIVSIYLAKLFIGWLLLHWYEKYNKKAYVLDWKAAVVGPIVVFLLLLLPIAGWIILTMLFFISIGALMQELVKNVPRQYLGKKVVKKVE